MIFYELPIEEKEIYDRKIKKLSEELRQCMYTANNRALVIDSICNEEKECCRQTKQLHSVIYAKNRLIKRLLAEQSRWCEPGAITANELIELRNAQIEAMQKEIEIMNSFVEGTLQRIDSLSRELAYITDKYNASLDIRVDFESL